MLIIVGLGNPTAEYAETYHNMGFKAVDAIAESFNKSIRKAECNALTVTFSRKNEKIVLAKPIDLPRYVLRARAFGSAGTHNGMRDVVRAIGTERFKRIRVGIGRSGYELKDYVLSRVPEAEREIFAKKFRLLAKIIKNYVADGDFDKLMREVNVVKG